MEFLSRYIDYIIFGILGFMSFVMIALTIERIIYFSRVDLSKFKDLKILEIELTKNLTAIGLIGANAPYVGLLGTVFGIIITFYDMGVHKNFETATIMSGLSIALKATALGLCVAIPSLISHGFLIRVVEKKRNLFLSMNGRDDED